MGGGSDVSSKPALSKDQKQVSSQVMDYLSGKIGQGMQTFGPSTPLQPGDTNYWYAPMGPGDVLGQQLMMQYAQQPQNNQLSTATIGHALQGLSPEATTQWFQNYVAPQQIQQFEQSVLPQVGENYVGSGNFWSSARREAQNKAHTDFATGLGSQLGQAIQQNRSQAIGMLPTIAALEQAQSQYPLQQAQAAVQSDALAQQLRLQELNARMQAFQQAQPEMSPTIQQALSYLGQQQIAMYGNQQGGGLGGAISGGMGGVLGGAGMATALGLAPFTGGLSTILPLAIGALGVYGGYNE